MEYGGGPFESWERSCGAPCVAYPTFHVIGTVGQSSTTTSLEVRAKDGFQAQAMVERDFDQIERVFGSRPRIVAVAKEIYRTWAA